MLVKFERSKSMAPKARSKVLVAVLIFNIIVVISTVFNFYIGSQSSVYMPISEVEVSVDTVEVYVQRPEARIVQSSVSNSFETLLLSYVAGSFKYHSNAESYARDLRDSGYPVRIAQYQNYSRVIVTSAPSNAKADWWRLN